MRLTKTNRFEGGRRYSEQSLRVRSRLLPRGKNDRSHIAICNRIRYNSHLSFDVGNDDNRFRQVQLVVRLYASVVYTLKYHKLFLNTCEVDAALLALLYLMNTSLFLTKFLPKSCYSHICELHCMIRPYINFMTASNVVHPLIY